MIWDATDATRKQLEGSWKTIGGPHLGENWTLYDVVGDKQNTNWKTMEDIRENTSGTNWETLTTIYHLQGKHETSG